MIYKDDRTSEELKTHTHLVSAIDTFMSGWGPCEGGLSVAVWACTEEQVDRIRRWVKDREEMKTVRVTKGEPYPRNANVAHTHIYAVNEYHPALQGGE